MLGPFVFQRRAVVTPAVAPLDDVSILDGLCAALREVAHIFDHPLEALLSPELARSERLVPIGSEDWPHEAEFYVSRRHFALTRVQLNVTVSFVGLLTELHGQRLDMHGVLHASFSEHRLSYQETHGGHSSTTPPFFLTLRTLD
jgi:hypothetical protein